MNSPHNTHLQNTLYEHKTSELEYNHQRNNSNLAITEDNQKQYSKRGLLKNVQLPPRRL